LRLPVLLKDFGLLSGLDDVEEFPDVAGDRNLGSAFVVFVNKVRDEILEGIGRRSVF
jgi:hypothetical protein